MLPTATQQCCPGLHQQNIQQKFNTDTEQYEIGIGFFNAVSEASGRQSDEVCVLGGDSVERFQMFCAPGHWWQAWSGAKDLREYGILHVSEISEKHAGTVPKAIIARTRENRKSPSCSPRVEMMVDAQEIVPADLAENSIVRRFRV